MNDSILIDAVRTRPEIYDKSHAGFKNPAIKEAAWKMVAEVVGASSADCFARWNTLRERLGKARRLVEMESRSGSAPSGRPEWSFTNAMSFLIPHIRKRKSIDNLPHLRTSTLSPRPSLSSPSPSPTLSLDEEMCIPAVSSPDTNDAVFVEQSVDNPDECSGPYTVIATCPDVPPTTPQAKGSSLASAASLPYLGPTGRSFKKPKVNETAEIFKETLANVNKCLAAPPPPPAPSSDPDSLIGRKC